MEDLLEEDEKRRHMLLDGREYLEGYSLEVIKFIDSVPRIRRIVLLRDIQKFLGKDLKIQMSKGPTRQIKFLSLYTEEKTPSMKMWVDGGFYCFSTGAAGCWVNLVDEIFKPTCDQHLISMCKRYAKSKKYFDRDQLLLF